MSATSILLGSVLTFAAADGNTLQLTVSLTEPATVALAWGDLARSSTVAKVRHTFGDLPVPKGASKTYRLAVGRETPREVEVRPIGDPNRLRIAVYGDSRDGSAPHRQVVEQIRARDVDVVVHSGDVIHNAQDERGWVEHLTASFPVSAARPILLALGNHEIAQGVGLQRVDGLARAMLELPPPKDALARSSSAPPAAFHVRIGPALFISLDSNQSLAEGTPQHEFLKRAIAERGDARFVFVCYHHGPLSSGPHGPHRDSGAIIRVLEAHERVVSLAGHDHIYERIVQNGVTYFVSGGGGAPLYRRRSETTGSRAFASTHNWVLIELDGEKATFEAFSLEGATLDRGDLIPPKSAVPPPPQALRPYFAGLAFACLLAALVWAGLRFARGRPDA